LPVPGFSNWYYYWAGTAVPGYDHTSGLYSYGGSISRWSAEYNDDVDNPHFIIFDRAAGEDDWDDAGLHVHVKGIEMLAVNLKHEKTHWIVALNWKYGGDWYLKSDFDLDGIPDEEEIKNAYKGLNWQIASSFTPAFWMGDDQQFWCEWKAQSAVRDASKDWSNPGKQSKNTY
jgi:hypothetical protein